MQVQQYKTCFDLAFKDWFIIGLELDYELSELLFQSVATKEGKKFVEKGRKGKKEGKGRKNSARGKAHKESSSRKHNQKAPEDMSDWRRENTCYCTSILG